MFLKGIVLIPCKEIKWHSPVYCDLLTTNIVKAISENTHDFCSYSTSVFSLII
jgi:hypothetical protein